MKYELFRFLYVLLSVLISSLAHTGRVSGASPAMSKLHMDPRAMQLPSLSPALSLALENDDASVLNRVLAEVSIYYFTKYPHMKSSDYYQAIGKKMTERYPVLKYPGTHPWVRKS